MHQNQFDNNQNHQQWKHTIRCSVSTSPHPEIQSTYSTTVLYPSEMTFFVSIIPNRFSPSSRSSSSGQPPCEKEGGQCHLQILTGSGKEMLHKYTNTHINRYKYAHKQIQIHTKTYTNTHINIYKYTHKQIQIHTETDTNTHRNRCKYTQKQIQIHK